MSAWTEAQDKVVDRPNDRANQSWDELEAQLRATGDPTVIALLDKHVGWWEAYEQLVDANQPRGQAIRSALEHVGRNLVGYTLTCAGAVGVGLGQAPLMSWKALSAALVAIAGLAQVVNNRKAPKS